MRSVPGVATVMLVSTLMISLAPASAQEAAKFSGANMRGAFANMIHVRNLSMMDGKRAFISSDHRLYLLNAAGVASRAPLGHYMLEDGGCVNVGADGSLDPATFKSLSKTTM